MPIEQLAAGQAFHKRVQAAFLTGLAGASGSPERQWRLLGEHRGRVDLAVEVEGEQMLVIIEIKGTNWDLIPTHRLMRNLRRHATAFHECGHSTGHQSRLARPGIVGFDHFGSDRYAKEELVAQMTSSILCAQTGIDTSEEFTNSASYISSWLQALQDDKRLVVSAAAQAQHASDMVIQPSREAELHRHPGPDKETKPRTATADPSPPRLAHVTEREGEAG